MTLKVIESFWAFTKCCEVGDEGEVMNRQGYNRNFFKSSWKGKRGQIEKPSENYMNYLIHQPNPELVLSNWKWYAKIQYQKNEIMFLSTTLYLHFIQTNM